MNVNEYHLNKFLQELCQEANTALNLPIQKEREAAFNYTIQRMFINIRYSALYFSRDVFLHWNYKEDDIKRDVMGNPEKYIIEVSDDLQEHPGLVIHFKK